MRGCARYFLMLEAAADAMQHLDNVRGCSVMALEYLDG
jgi:hypothetical protein